MLSVIGDSDPLFAHTRESYGGKLPPQPHSRLLEVNAVHLSTHEVAQPEVLAWVKAAVAEPAPAK